MNKLRFKLEMGNDGLRVGIEPLPNTDTKEYAWELVDLFWGTHHNPFTERAMKPGEEIRTDDHGCAVHTIPQDEFAQASTKGYTTLSALIAADRVTEVLPKSGAAQSAPPAQPAQASAAPAPQAAPTAPSGDVANNTQPPTGTLTGTLVDKYNDYGFVESGGDRYFVSRTRIEPSIRSQLYVGSEILFEVDPASQPKRPRDHWEAINVRLTTGQSGATPNVTPALIPAPAVPPSPAPITAPASPSTPAAATSPAVNPVPISMIGTIVKEMGVHGGKLVLGVTLSFVRGNSPAANVAVSLRANDQEVVKPRKEISTTGSGQANFIVDFLKPAEPYCIFLIQVEGHELSHLWSRAAAQPAVAASVPTGTLPQAQSSISTPAAPTTTIASPRSPAPTPQPATSSSGRQFPGLTVDARPGEVTEKAGIRALPVWVTVTYTETKTQKSKEKGKADQKSTHMVPAAGVAVALTVEGKECVTPDPRPTATANGQVYFELPLAHNQQEVNIHVGCEGKNFYSRLKVEGRLTLACDKGVHTQYGTRFNLQARQVLTDDARPGACRIEAQSNGGSDFSLALSGSSQPLNSTGGHVEFESSGDTEVTVLITNLHTNTGGDHVVFRIAGSEVKTEPKYVSAMSLARKKREA